MTEPIDLNQNSRYENSAPTPPLSNTEAVAQKAQKAPAEPANPSTDSALDLWIPTLKKIFTFDFTPVRVRRFFLNFIWYVFVMILVGQLGSVLAIAIAFWEQKSISQAITAQANSGNFLTFAVALIAGSSYFIVREFHNDKGVEHAHLKSPLLLLSIVFATAGALVSAWLGKSPGVELSAMQMLWHWILYAISIGLSVIWWVIEEMKEPVNSFNDDVNSKAKRLTKRSNESGVSAKSKIRV